jgi:hypothetical protein
MQARTLGFAAALAATALTPVAAMSQIRDPSARASRAEALIAGSGVTQSRDNTPQDAATRVTAESTVAPTAATGVEIKNAFILGASASYNSNPAQVSSGEDGDEHLSPSAVFVHKRIYPKGNVFKFQLVGQVDDYIGRSDVDQSLAVLTLAYQFSDQTKTFAPYVSYDRAEICFSASYETCKLSLDIATVGLARDLALGANTGLSFKVAAGRRWSNIAEAELTRAIISIEAGGPFRGSNVSWGTTHVFEFQSYTGGTNDGRDDVNYKGAIAISVPINADKSAELALALQVEHNNSDVATRDFTAWDIGPAISLKRAF